MLELEAKRREPRCRGIGHDAETLPFGRLPVASIHDGAPQRVDMDLIEGGSIGGFDSGSSRRRRR
jgi:hypothetical protein